MNAPQIIILVLFFISLLISANQHGKNKTGKHDFFVSLFSSLLHLLLLYWGGFFK